MPIELLGEGDNAVRRIRPATPREDAQQEVDRLRKGVRDLWPYRPHLLELEGSFLHYVDEGPRDAPVLLCVHGNPTWSFHWRALLEQLTGRYRVIALDHMGMGLSQRPLDWNYKLAAHQAGVERLVEELDLQDVTLVVHDWGGPIGLGALARHSERLARVVVLNSFAWPEGQVPLALRLGRLPVLGSVLLRNLGVMNAGLSGLASEHGLDADAERGFTHPYRDFAARIAVHQFVRDIPTSPRHPSYADLAAVDAALPALADRPALVLWGMHDWVFTPTVLRQWRERWPRAEVHEIEHAGHLVLEDATGECLEALRAFLERTGG